VHGPGPHGRVVRVRPDVGAIDKEFDYLVPAEWVDDGRADRLAVGSMVRVDLGGRRVAGWITALDVEPPAGVELAPLRKLSGAGPPEELLELAEWAAWRWAGRRVAFLRAASPDRMVAGVPTPPRAAPVPSGPADRFDAAFDLPVAVIRPGPADDVTPIALAACRRGDALIVAPDLDGARRLGLALRRAGVHVAIGADDWPRAAGGATVVGPRSAVWMPMPRLAAVVVLDEHDEGLHNERTPTWHARTVALERARRRDVPAVLVSATPTLEALRAGRLLRPDPAAQRQGWPRVEVLDRRDDDPTRAGPFAEGLRDRIPADGRVVAVLNRKGRATLLACAACGELVRSDDGRVPMRMADHELVAADGSQRRPVICAHCGSTTLKTLRMGVQRAAEELAALVGEPVEEVTAEAGEPPSSRVVIGTEAVLHRVRSAAMVAFLDIDQELLSPRQRAAEQALALLARGARLLGRRADGGRMVVQTRMPDHDVVRAAASGDPSIVAVAERDRRKATHAPPYGADALVSGEAAAEFIEMLGRPLGVQVRGPLDDRWLLRAEEHGTLLDALAATPRPTGRLRIEVDPLRV